MSIVELRERGADLLRLKSNKQRRFALEYLIDQKPKAAAIRAGYSPGSAAVRASENLKNPIIKAYVGKAEREHLEKLELDCQEILKQLYYAATRQVRDFCNDDGIALLPHQLPENVQSIVDGFEQEIDEKVVDGEVVGRKIKMKYKVTPHAVAREQAMKREGMFAAQKIDIESHVTVDLKALYDMPPEPDIIEDTICKAKILKIKDEGK